MFNLFPAHVDLYSVVNILFGNCTRVTFCYISRSSLWLDRLFVDFSHENSNECKGINKRRPTKFRTKAGNPGEQRCYLHISSNDKQYNMYISKRFFNKDSQTDEPHFKIE